RHTQTIRLTDAQGRETASSLVLGEVVGIHIAPQLIEGGVYDTVAADPVLRGGGWGDYFTLSPEGLFRMKRPG
ncbi:hypothetical protein ABTN15_20110, partial [Acinetobacter baumannii]